MKGGFVCEAARPRAAAAGGVGPVAAGGVGPVTAGGLDQSPPGGGLTSRRRSFIRARTFSGRFLLCVALVAPLRSFDDQAKAPGPRDLHFFFLSDDKIGRV